MDLRFRFLRLITMKKCPQITGSLYLVVVVVMGGWYAGNHNYISSHR